MSNPNTTTHQKFSIDFDEFERLAKEIQDFTRREKEDFDSLRKSTENDD